MPDIIMNSAKPTHFFIIAGEPSGDQHGGLLLQAIRESVPDARFSGIGGSRMIAQGLTSLVELDKMAVMGFVEVIRHLGFFRQLQEKVLKSIEEFSPDRIILIDYPGFNLRIARRIKERWQIPITYYISPQLWAWKAKRVEQIRKTIDQMLVIFPFEVEWYARHQVDAEFVGHPFLDEWQPVARESLCERLHISADRPILTLFPGSRRQELDRHLNVFLDAAQMVWRRIPNLQILLGAAPGFSSDSIQSHPLSDHVIIISEDPRKALEAADAAIVASGTSTLEGAVFGTPMAIVYRLAAISWWLSRRLVKVPFAGMANILAEKQIVPEFLQQHATPEAISTEIIRQLTDQEYVGQMKSDLEKVKLSLGSPGASRRAAEAILGHQL